MASDAALAWVERTFDLTPHVKGKSAAALGFRLYDKRGVSNFGVRVSLAALEATGFTMDNPTSRKNRVEFFDERARLGTPCHYLCDPERQRHVYEAVRDLYAGSAAPAHKAAARPSVQGSPARPRRQPIERLQIHQQMPGWW